MRSIGRLADIVIDCSEPAPLAAFWHQVLGLQITRESDDWISLIGADEVPRISFQKVNDYQPPKWPSQVVPQQFHFDVLVDDLHSADAAVIALGAEPLTDILDPQEDAWRIYADPQGHPFCLVTAIASAGSPGGNNLAQA